MKTIWEYEITPFTHYLELPKDAKPLCVQMQVDNPTCPKLWAEVESTNPIERRQIAVVFTGGAFPSGHWQYAGTCQTSDSSIVLHVYIEER